MPDLPFAKLFHKFFASERSAGLLLVFCTIISVLLSNSPLATTWLNGWNTHLHLFDKIPSLNLSMEDWINEGLMTLFFLIVGLEIKRELIAGELASFKKALLPLIAALGGMLIPAAIHYLFNRNTTTQQGFGIPMATDIAFALGVLSLLGNKVPASLRIFLTALAIMDDLGAIIVIALFYTQSLAWGWLAVVLVILLLLRGLNKMGVDNLLLYVIPGTLIWYAMLRSGVHATLSGVLLAFVIPFRQKKQSGNPSEKLLHLLHKPVTFMILPLFALANTAIRLPGNWSACFLSPNSGGILLGLLVGKPLGILSSCWLAIRFWGCQLPDRVNWSHLLGMGLLAGIGFTMSIFITNLAFTAPDTIEFSKIAILTASLFAASIGLTCMSQATKQPFPSIPDALS